MVTLPIGLDDEIVKKIDALVENGVYKNRTEALRDQIVKGIQKIEVIELNQSKKPEFKAILDSLLSMDSPPSLLKSDKSVVEMVSEGRQR